MPQGQRNALAAGEHVDSPLRWPLVNQLQVRNTSTPLTKDARLINCYAEYDPEDKEYFVYKRVGLSATPAFSAGASTGLGLYTETGSMNIFSVFGPGLYIGFGGGGPFFTVDGTAPYFFETLGPAQLINRQVVLGNGVAAYYIVLDSGPPFNREEVFQITDPNFPTAFVPGWASLDGYVYVMDTSGTIYGTVNQYDASTWSALDTIKASSNADLGIALFKQLNYIVALKQYTTQVFYDAGNAAPGSPLSPVPDAQVAFGCLHAGSVQAIDDTLLWLTSNQTISPQIVQMDNLVPKIVSTAGVERLLDGVTWTIAALGIRSWVLKHGGHRWYGLTILALNLTLIYDMDQKLWYIWTDYQGNYWPVLPSGFSEPAGGVKGIHYAQHLSNGNIYAVDGDYVYTNDYGNLFPVDIYTPNLDFGTIRGKYLKGMYFRGDRTPNSILNVRFSDDDYTSWSNFRNVDMSKKTPKLMDNGTFQYRRAYHYRHLCNTPLRLKSVDLAMDVCTL